MVRPTPFKHVGIFPEQASNWAWTEALREKLENEGVERPRMLNLFGYTGAASVLAAQAGWEVTHVDSSRASMDWAAENARLSDLPSDSIRWMLEDAMKFAGREVRREKHYHLVLLDPPAYGRGAKGEKWEFSDGIASLLEDCKTILEPSGSAGIVLSAYAIDFSALALSNLFSDWGGELEAGELALPEESENRFLPCGYCFRWSRV
jgi:23S rRNA (cytosine1962-C5)-methyltransferase